MPLPAPPPEPPSSRRQHPTALVFLDESGVIIKDRIFGIGVLKLPDPAKVHRTVQKLRDQVHQYGEFKFSLINDGNLEVYKRLVSTAIGSGSTEFWCFIADRRAADPIVRFGGPWAAYGSLRSSSSPDAYIQTAR